MLAFGCDMMTVQVWVMSLMMLGRVLGNPEVDGMAAVLALETMVNCPVGCDARDDVGRSSGKCAGDNGDNGEENDEPRNDY